MSTPFDPTPPIPTPPVDDLTAYARQNVDLTATVQAQTEATIKLLKTLGEHMEAIRGDVTQLPEAFTSFVNGIKKANTESAKLEKSQKNIAGHAKDTKFSIAQTVQALMHGNIGGALGELTQGIWGRERITNRIDTDYAKLYSPEELARYGDKRPPLFDALKRIRAGGLGGLGGAVEGEAAAGGLGRMAGLGGMAGLAGMAGLERLMTPAVILGTLKVMQELNAQRNAETRLGKATGEGFGAGIAATGFELPIPIIGGMIGHIGGEAGHLRGIGLIGDKEAQEIVQGVRGTGGFRGSQARAVEQSVADIVNTLGISVQDAMTVALPAIKQANMSTTQLKYTMSDLSAEAKSSGVAVGELAKQVGDLISQNLPTSRLAAQISPAQQAVLREQFKGTPLAKNTAALNSIFTSEARQGVAAVIGVSPLLANTDNFVQNYLKEWDKAVLMFAKGNVYSDGKRRIPWHEYIAIMRQTPNFAAVFGSMYDDDIIDAFRRVLKMTDNGANPQALSVQAREASQAHKARTAKDNIKALEKSSASHQSLWQFVTSWKVDHPHATQKQLYDHISQFKNNPNLLGETDNIIRSLNLGKDARLALEAPLRKAIKQGNEIGIYDALGKLGDRIVDATKHSKTNVTISMKNGARSILNAEHDKAAQGRASQQGTRYYNP